MSRRGPLLASFALNTTLLAAWWWWPTPNAALKAPARTTRPPVTQAEPTPPRPASLVATPGRASCTVNWAALADEDFDGYQANLRAIGCPEATIRDILESAINDRFARRLQALVGPFQSRFWQLLAELRLEDEFKQVEGQIQILRDEREKLMKELFGRPPDKDEENIARQRDERRRDMDYLPADKRERLLAVEERYRKLRDEIAEQASQKQGGGLDSQDKARLKRLAEQEVTERGLLLSPSEAEEYRLRQSGEARWAEGLAGFEPTEEEMRTVARLRKDHASEEQIKSVLGAQRYVEYQRAKDDDFQQLYRVGRRYQMPEDVVVQAFEMRHSVLESAEQVRRDRSLSSEARQSVLRAIRQETTRTLEKTLGEEAARTYGEYGGNWLQELDRLDPR